MESIEPLRMLPRFDSHETDLDKISQSNSVYRYNPLSYEKIQLLPRFQSDHRRNYYDENQSADTEIKAISQTKINDNNYRSNKFHIKFLERTHDRSGKKCWPVVNTNIGKLDLEYSYEIVGNALESYIRYRKLNRCKALSNFIEYRNKVYKREKIAQYALPESKTQMKEIDSKETINFPTQMIHREEEQTPSGLPSPLLTSETGPPTPVPSLQSMTSEASQKLSLTTPIPSSHSMSPRTSQKLFPPTPISSSKSMSPKTSRKLSQSSPIPSSKSMSPKTSRKLSQSSPAPSSKSMSPRTSRKLSQSSPAPSLRSMSPQTSRKLSQSSPAPSSKSMSPRTSRKLSQSTPIPSSKSMSPQTSRKLSTSNTKEAIMPIPSPDLLRSPIPKLSKMNIPKKTNSNIKHASSSSVKGQS